MQIRTLVAFAAVMLLASLTPVHGFGRFFFDPVDGGNSGTTCAGCTIITGLIEQLTQVHNETAEKTLDKFCSYLPTPIGKVCEKLVKEFGPELIVLIDNHYTPDAICKAIGLCTQTTTPVCHLFPLPKNPEEHFHAAVKQAQESRDRRGVREYTLPKYCEDPVLKQICDFIDNFANNHMPLFDVDGDGHSTEETFRGSNWRGKDCDDFDRDVYPGRVSDGDKRLDTNCNGIKGVDPETLKPWEDILCKDTPQYGSVVLGDSASAHFHIPAEWITATQVNATTYENQIMMLANELDWPMLSLSSGYMNSTWWQIVGETDSFYARAWARNRCMHRDYQNIGVNGARSSAMNSSLQQSMRRDQKLDHPVILSYALVGNDVCNGHHDIDHMTTPTEMRANVLSTLKYLEEKLPKGSVVMLVGLADGGVLYDTLSQRIHPIGSTRNDVTYAAFYDYLNCLEVSPCFGWMNSNATWRQRTTERANELSDVLKQVAANNTYSNFELLYLDNPIDEVIRRWNAAGGETWQLIEPVDGFHPNQIGNYIGSGVVWDILEKDYPHVLPPINPNNDRIIKEFGDQGGY